jgi:hypothetical protein
MSAQVALLSQRLEQAVLVGAISLAEAWTFQDLLSISPADGWLDLPEALHPMASRMWLLEVPPHNQLPI